MRRSVLAVAIVLAASRVVASDVIFELSGWAEIPSTYRHPGPVSGQFTGPNNGVTPPYSGQPIPGFSGMIPGDMPGSYVALPDNGYGAQGNSADFVIGFYIVIPHFKVTGDGTSSRGSVTVNSFTPFSDPQGLLDSSYITNGPVYQRTTYYPPPAAQLAVDPSIRDSRLLTGADFDVESIARMDDGTFWVGEEFGPYLLHFDEQGRLLSPPVRHPVLRAPQNPQNSAQNPANLPKLYLFDLEVADENTGVLKKRLLVDLLDIDDPEDIGGPVVGIADGKFNFPLQSVESVTPVDDFTLMVGLDNNYPGGNGRVPGTPDGTEIITLHSTVPLRTLRVQPCKETRMGAHNGWSRAERNGPDCR